MTTSVFLAPRLSGPRFDEHSIPLEVLRDLAALEEMIVEVAKWRFLEANPTRKRSPRGFGENIELRLTEIGDGSAVPTIALVAASATLFPTDNQVYVEEARDHIVDAIAAAEESTPVPEDVLPSRFLSYFDRIGRSLRDGEALEFDRSGGRTARLTPETRRTLVGASQAREFTEETVVRGVVPEADQDDMTFEVSLADGRKITAPITPEHLGTILDAFNGYGHGVRISIQGVGRFDRKRRIVKFDTIEHVTTLDDRDVLARIDEIALLKDGWLDGKGHALDQDWLIDFATEFVNAYPDELPLPFVYPTPEGGLQFEWTNGPWEASMELAPGSYSAEWHAIDVSSRSEREADLDLKSDADWHRLVDEVRAVCGVSA